MLTLKGDHIVPEFIKILDDYVESHYAAKEQLVSIQYRVETASRPTSKFYVLSSPGARHGGTSRDMLSPCSARSACLCEKPKSH
jgi:lysine/ornithine N-monooxygenase